MGYIKQKVIHWIRSGDSYVQGDIYSDFYNFQVNKGATDTQDTFHLNIINANNKLDSGSRTFNIGDRLSIYVWSNTETPDESNILMDGIITKPVMTIAKGKVLQISGKNILEYLFTTPVFLSIDTSTTTPYVIKEILLKVNDLNKSAGADFSINFIMDGMLYNSKNVSGTPTTSGDTISKLKSNGDTITYSFSSISSFYKAAYLLLEEYSSVEYTEDTSPHMAYIKIGSDGKNYFYWQPRTSNITDSITEGVEPTQIKTGIKEEIINAVIGNCGQDANNHGITVFAAEYSSISRHGTKWKYSGKYRTTADELINAEIATNPNSFDVDSGKFPTSAVLSAGYTFKWGTEVSTKKEYNDELRKHAQAVVSPKLLSEIKGTENPNFTVDIELPRVPTYSLGEFVPVTIGSYALAKNLRIMTLSHSIWNTEIGFEEDTPSGT